MTITPVFEIAEYFMNPITSNQFQTYLSTCNDQEKTKAVQILTQDRITLVKMAKNAYGYALNLISKDFQNPCEKISYGCVCLRHCINYCRLDQKNIIIAEIIKDSVGLATDYEGHLLLQYLLGLSRRPSLALNICFLLKDHVEVLSRDRHSNYLLTLCIKSSSGELIIEELVSLGPEKIEELAMDPFANYAIQTAFKHVDERMNPEFHEKLVDIIRQLPDELSSHKHARHVMNLVRSDENARD